MRTIVAIIMLLAIQTVHAQAYRCTVDGRVVFQQQPCSGGAKVASEAVPQALPALHSAGSQVCEAHARQSELFDDPESLRVNAVAYLGARPFTIHTTVVAARVYGLRINSKNSYGAYVGASAYECYLSEDGHRVLRFGKAGVALQQ